MRLKTILFFTLFFSLQIIAGKVIKNPEIEYRARWMTITEIELTKEATIIRGTLGQGSSIINNTVLRDRNSGKEYKFLRVEGIKAHEQAVDGTTCSVYFEPLDAEVKEFNYIEVGNNMLGNYYGIKLQSKTKQSKREVANSGTREVNPESLDFDYYMSQPYTPNTKWHFSNLPYKSAFEGGKAQIKIHIKKLPKEIANMVPSVTARVTNQITRQEETILANIDENNSFTLDLNLPYPQFIYINSFGNLFITPGDTLEMFTTIETAPDNRGPRFKTFRSKGESAVINTLLPKLIEKYGKKEYNYKEASEMIAKGKDAVQPVLERWANQANEIIADEEFRQALINSPLSTFGKDIVMMSAVTNKCIEVEDVMLNYQSNQYTQTQSEYGSVKLENNPNYVPLEYDLVYGILLKNKDLIFNNALVLCEFSQWVFVNRTLYSQMLNKWNNDRDEHGNIINQYRCDDYGMAGTFMNDLWLSQHIVGEMKQTQKDDKLGQLGEYRSVRLDYMANSVGESLAGIQNIKVAQTITNEYRNFVKATETGTEEIGTGWTEEQEALWNKIVSYYKGNLLLLDFWNMGCGPCRSGMMSQKKIVEELKDEPVKFLYINTDDEKEASEKWMGEKSIKGEHIYITKEEWRQFQTMINFQAIPRCVLVGKNGKLIERDFDITSASEIGELIKRF